MMTIDEVRVHVAQNPDRAHVLVNETKNGFVAVVGDKIYIGSNVFQLDSNLTAGGEPEPRNLYLVPEGSEL